MAIISGNVGPVATSHDAYEMAVQRVQELASALHMGDRMLNTVVFGCPGLNETTSCDPQQILALNLIEILAKDHPELNYHVVGRQYTLEENHLPTHYIRAYLAEVQFFLRENYPEFAPMLYDPLIGPLYMYSLEQLRIIDPDWSLQMIEQWTSDFGLVVGLPPKMCLPSVGKYRPGNYRTAQLTKKMTFGTSLLRYISTMEVPNCTSDPFLEVVAELFRKTMDIATLEVEVFMLA